MEKYKDRILDSIDTHILLFEKNNMLLSDNGGAERDYVLEILNLTRKKFELTDSKMVKQFHYTTINNQLNTIDRNYNTFLRELNNSKNLVQVLNSFYNSVDIYLKQINTFNIFDIKNLDDLDSKLNDVSSVAINLSNNYTDFQEKINILENRLVSQNSRLEKQLQDGELKISKGVSNLNKAMKTQLDKTKNKIIEDLKLDVSNEYKDLSNSTRIIKEESEKNYNIILKKKDQIFELLKIVGDETIKKDYSNAKKVEFYRTIGWRALTIILFIITIGLSAYITYEVFTAEEEYTLTMLLSRTLVVTAVGAFIAFTSKLSANHNYLYRFYRQQEVEHSVIDAYLSSMSEEDKLRVKSILAERYFATAKFPNKNTKDDSSENIGMYDLIQILKNGSKIT